MGIKAGIVVLINVKLRSLYLIKKGGLGGF